MKTKRLLAFDLGASNGRAVLGAFDGARVALTEVHRFDNPMVEQNGLYYWDALGLYRNLKESFLKLKHEGLAADCFGIDTWGVDFGLIDHNGALLGNPRCYRNGTEAGMAAVHGVVPQKTLFSRTGIASMPFNTLYQLYSRIQENDPALERAQTLLFSPDLYGYFFTGEQRTEYSIATTSMLYDGENRRWDTDTMRALNIPERVFTEVDFAGTLRGRIRESVADELGISRVPFAAVGSHDTASAVAAIPGEGNFAFCSSGTWSLFGVESDKPVKTDAVFDANFSNEGTAQGTFRLLKNIMGLWLVQECRRDWQKQGNFLSYDEIDAQAHLSPGLVSVIDTDDASFYAAGNMQKKIRQFLRAHASARAADGRRDGAVHLRQPRAEIPLRAGDAGDVSRRPHRPAQHRRRRHEEQAHEPTCGGRDGQNRRRRACRERVRWQSAPAGGGAGRAQGY